MVQSFPRKRQRDAYGWLYVMIMALFMSGFTGAIIRPDELVYFGYGVTTRAYSFMAWFFLNIGLIVTLVRRYDQFSGERPFLPKTDKSVKE